jgi:hypothetical protein
VLRCAGGGMRLTGLNGDRGDGCSGLAEKSVVKRPCDRREVETTIMIATDPADSAVVVMC